MALDIFEIVSETTALVKANLHGNRNPSKNEFLKIEGSETQKLLDGNKPSEKILWNHNDPDVRQPLEFPKISLYFWICQMVPQYFIEYKNRECISEGSEIHSEIDNFRGKILWKSISEGFLLPCKLAFSTEV